jgi:hypothetical protein
VNHDSHNGERADRKPWPGGLPGMTRRWGFDVLPSREDQDLPQDVGTVWTLEHGFPGLVAVSPQPRNVAMSIVKRYRTSDLSMRA